jgi:flavin-dependent dehydrogenase
LRTNLTGAHFYKNNLLVIGEAAGTTYSFSGEGIGKAMESAIIAAKIIMENDNVDHIGKEYEKKLLNEFRDRFHGYKIAQDWLSSPTVCNLISWRANHGKYLHRQLEGMLQETVDARDIFSISGILKSMIF